LPSHGPVVFAPIKVIFWRVPGDPYAKSLRDACASYRKEHDGHEPTTPEALRPLASGDEQFRQWATRFKTIAGRPVFCSWQAAASWARLSLDHATAPMDSFKRMDIRCFYRDGAALPAWMAEILTSNPK
jgi:hypothetical protein